MPLMGTEHPEPRKPGQRSAPRLNSNFLSNYVDTGANPGDREEVFGSWLARLEASKGFEHLSPAEKVSVLIARWCKPTKRSHNDATKAVKMHLESVKDAGTQES